MTLAKVGIETLKMLEPIRSLSEERLRELANLCYVESVGKALDPFRARSHAGQSVYLVRGEMSLIYPGGGSGILVGGSEEARFPLGRRGPMFSSAKALTDVELVRIDDDLLDIMVTWDQLAATEAAHRTRAVPAEGAMLAKWSIMSGMFSVSNLKYGAFAQLPPAHIEELLGRFKRIEAKSGEVIIREGAEGDYYYVVESGKARVERMIGGVLMLLADLKSGDAFGEEALVSEAKRNATVTMRTDGERFVAIRREGSRLEGLEWSGHGLGPRPGARGRYIDGEWGMRVHVVIEEVLATEPDPASFFDPDEQGTDL